jgi:hypothetical protein
MMKKRAQVWVETVLYTLIGLALIGTTLAFLMPKINEAQEKLLVDQATNSLSSLDEKINTVIQTGEGNVRNAEFLMKKGELYFNVSKNEIIFVLKGISKPRSEPGIEVSVGRITMLSLQGPKDSTVLLKVNYTANITFGNSEQTMKFNPASLPYTFTIENKGIQGSKELINIDEISNR